MSDIVFRNYKGDRTGSGDYGKVHCFLVRNAFPDYTYGRFDWMMTNWDYLEDRFLDRIGIWEEAGEIVGVTLFDHSLDVIFPLVKIGYEHLYAEMIEYAKKNMVNEDDPNLSIYANDRNTLLQAELTAHGFHALEEREAVAAFDFGKPIPDSGLPDGYTFTTLAEEDAPEKYFTCLFKGFDHELNGETFSFDYKKEKEFREAYHRSCLDPELKISVKDPKGDHIAHCGMWYDTNSEFALIEPVCVIPEYRRMGFGKAVVSEGLRRVKRMGAGSALVGSDQRFYFSLGMVPHTCGTLWRPGSTE